jgi:glycosyltransferase involved in cell wall biosynthesis
MDTRDQRRGPFPALVDPTVSVIIAAWTERRFALLAEAARSALDQQPAPLEVIVVCDHNPGLLARVQAELPAVRAVASTGAQGAAGARDTGGALARGDVIAFLDDDAAAQPGWLARLGTAYADPACLGAGGALEPAWETERPRWFPDEFGWVIGCSYRGLPEAMGPVRNLIAANMSVRRTVFEELDGFRDGFGKVGDRSEPEETELWIRARQRWTDGEWLYDPLAVARHHVDAGRTSRRYFVRRCWLEGRGKASLVRLVGRGGLGSEWGYTLRTLPSGVLRGLLEALRGDAGGLGRAVAIAAGLVITTGGYAAGLLRP